VLLPDRTAPVSRERSAELRPTQLTLLLRQSALDLIFPPPRRDPREVSLLLASAVVPSLRLEQYAVRFTAGEQSAWPTLAVWLMPLARIILTVHMRLAFGE